MSNQKGFAIYGKLYQFTKALYSAVHNMPKEYKYEIGRETIALSWDCLDLALSANSSSEPNEKFIEIKKLSLSFDKLKIRIRMAEELKIISSGQFSHWQETWLLETGRMIGAWLKWSKENI